MGKAERNCRQRKWTPRTVRCHFKRSKKKWEKKNETYWIRQASCNAIYPFPSELVKVSVCVCVCEWLLVNEWICTNVSSMCVCEHFEGGFTAQFQSRLECFGFVRWALLGNLSSTLPHQTLDVVAAAEGLPTWKCGWTRMTTRETEAERCTMPCNWARVGWSMQYQ